MDLNLWVICVEEVAERLSQFDPSHASDYRENAAAYRQQLLALDQYARAAIASIPENNRLFVTSHDAFQYFGRAYGLRVLGIQGISTESEAGLRHVNQLVDLLVEQRLPAVFFESSVPQRSIEALVAGVRSRGHNLSISGPLFSDAMGPEGTYTGTYLGMLDHNITLVAHKLGGQVPERGWQGQLGDASETEQAAQ
jgi:manganese/zinc/iron transport system substrate-binding protein